jgi:integrase
MPRSRPPSYRLHKPSGQAVVTLSGRDIYLGKYDSPESHGRYDELVAQWLASGRNLPDPGRGITINELADAYQRHANVYYRKDGKPTPEVGNVRYALQHVRILFGSERAAEFTATKLKAVQEACIRANLCLNEVNRRTKLVRRAFRWAVSEGFVDPMVAYGLGCLAMLKPGRSTARTTEPVRPVPEAYIDAIRPYLSRQVMAMIDLQLLTGARPGEVCQARTCDLDTRGPIWEYRPASHKGQHHGKRRLIFLGPRAQEVVRPFLRVDIEEPMFQPREVVAEMYARQSRERKTGSGRRRVRRRKRNPENRAGMRYSTVTYNQAIRGAIRQANKAIKETDPSAPEVPHWHANQLRHNYATACRKQFGLDAARLVLGHSSAEVTEVYAEPDLERVREVARLLG